jgi:hypothetical protein
MVTHAMSEQAYRRDLGGGLVLRWSTATDVEAIGQLYSYVFRPAVDAPPDTVTVAWLRDLMSGRHPLRRWRYRAGRRYRSPSRCRRDLPATAGLGV